MRIIKLKIFPVPVRLHSGYGKLIFIIISPFFAIFKNVVQSLELLGVSPGFKLWNNDLKYLKTRWNNDKNTSNRNRNATATKPDFSSIL